MGKRITIQDIADSLGVSRNTVSKALNNTGVLADATRDRILQKAAELGYKQFSYYPPLASIPKPENTALFAVAADTIQHFIIGFFAAQAGQLLIKIPRQFTGFRACEIEAADTGVQPFQTVEDQTVNRVTGGKCQTAEDVIIILAERIGIIIRFIFLTENFQ